MQAKARDHLVANWTGVNGGHRDGGRMAEQTLGGGCDA